MSLPQNLEQMKTGEVAQIARQRGIPNLERMDKQEMIQALQRQAGGQTGGQAGGQLPENLERMHLGELEQLARQRGIQVSPEWRKEDVIRALRGQMGGQSGGGGGGG